ncbi:MFS transporter [Devosia epidermidihirudinis]|uniref:MFS transporter n=1 Tax=Devosia epidermidihirudinis TaxID=1293439 RepID=A0A0F5QDD1_9HYPH|nr:CynX/NimT family MFS transporter [Devosia epidermidihirudinis]KKC38014.1 MFS transporter [Devosia epidermidihirudinis]
MSASHRRLHPAWIIAGILVFATNLRGPFTAISPLLDTIRDTFGMGSSEAGFLITLPLLTFCIVSPFAGLLAREYGLERALFAALIVMAGGIALRSTGPSWALFVGTAVLGGGIAIGNTLLPSLIKRDFPSQITKLTAIYSVTMGVVSAVGSAMVVPLLYAFNWQVSLGAFLVLPIVSALIWLPQLRRHSRPSADTAAPPHGGPIWRSPLAWQVTLFFGINSFVYYAVAAWLPSILVDLGYTQGEAGSLHGTMQLASALPGLLIVPIVQRARDQRGLAVGLALAGLVSLIGLKLFPLIAIVWVSLFGFGIGGAFIVALAFIGLRTSSAQQTASLSGMTQSIGYLMSATGPVLVGLLHDATNDWSTVLMVCMAMCVVLAGVGLGAGRAIHIDTHRPTKQPRLNH